MSQSMGQLGGNICFPELQSSAELGLRYNADTSIKFSADTPSPKGKNFRNNGGYKNAKKEEE